MAVRRVPVTPLDAGIRQPLLDICRQRIRVLGFVDLVADLYLQAVALLFAETQIIAKVLPEIVVLVLFLPLTQSKIPHKLFAPP